MKTTASVMLVALLAWGCGSDDSKDKEVQAGVEAVAKALADKADECGYELDPDATFECDASVDDAEGLQDCATSLKPLTCDYLESLEEGEPETPECAPFQDVCDVR